MTAPRKPALKADDWAQIPRDASGLSDEESLLIALLAEGKAQTEIGAALGLSRSGVWHRVRNLRQKVGQ
jgi:DNA-binding NarL/FixJ family response regulator